MSPCTTAMISNVVTAHADQSVEEVMAILEKHQIRALPIVDENNILLGMFSTAHLIKNLLPVSATMDDGLQRLSFVIGAAPGVAKRLRKLKPRMVEELMDRNVVVARPDTPTWESLRLMSKYGSPIPVVDEDSGKLLGIISEQSAIQDLHRIIEDVEIEEASII